SARCFVARGEQIYRRQRVYGAPHGRVAATATSRRLAANSAAGRDCGWLRARDLLVRMEFDRFVRAAFVESARVPCLRSAACHYCLAALGRHLEPWLGGITG